MIHGIGINDRTVPIKINGKLTKSYSRWKSILQRCYSSKCHSSHPTYKNCTICDEWKTYSNFLKWYQTNYVEGYHLDKDILFEGNTIYSPDTCVFVPQEINNILADSMGRRGNYSIGVSFIKRDRKFQSSISMNGKIHNLGWFDSEQEAHEIWKIAKTKYVAELVNSYYEHGLISNRIKDALLSRTFS